MSSGFFLFAGALAVGAALLVLLPLIRRREDLPASITSGVVLSLLVLAGAAGLYTWLSDFKWDKATSVADTPAAMTAKLARRVAREPNDLQGWLMLGRSYTELQQFPLAARAYQRADALAQHGNVEALMGLAESVIAENSEEIAGEAGRLFDRILELEPRNVKGLFYGAYAALSRGDVATGRARFEGMLGLNLPGNIREIVQKQIQALDASGTEPAPGGAAAATSGAQVQVRVSVSPGLRYKLTPESTLFVLARDPNQPGPPFAAKRLPLQFPVEVTLSAADAMLPQRQISAGQTLDVVARISLSGQPQGASGDPFGQVSYHVGKDGKLNLVIDKVAP